MVDRVRNMVEDLNEVRKCTHTHTHSRSHSSCYKVTLEDHKTQVTKIFKESGLSPVIAQRLLRYLNYNHYHLPMYGTTDMV